MPSKMIEALTLSTLGKIFSRQHTDFFFFFFFFFNFSQKTEFDFACKWSPRKTIYMKCQILFSGRSKKIITILSSAELIAQRVEKVNSYSEGGHKVDYVDRWMAKAVACITLT